jgi:hypothetical protein
MKEYQYMKKETCHWQNRHKEIVTAWLGHIFTDFNGCKTDIIYMACPKKEPVVCKKHLKNFEKISLL